MAFTERNTHWRDQKTCVEITSIKALFARLLTAIRAQPHPHIKDLSDHHLHDIGLMRGDLEQHKHKLPSQHIHHPRG